ncbi:MAG TPA: AarF/UbiB family protein [Candidatus Nanoarchaeia archaeon]|nr:AarF/UbiB family protein [Candidatus Nanoarchaeia archaeon]
MTTGSIKRASQVLEVLHRHKLGKALVQLGLAGHLPFLKRFSTGPLPQDLPKQLREAMEELGGAYIKLGQMLSIRPDLVPQEYCDEFSKLLDEVPPEPYSDIIQTIEAEFGKKAKDLYAHIEHSPLGSASVAQVHKARLKDGKSVVIKVQRTNVAEQFSADINILRYLAQKLQTRLKNNVNPILIIEEFERYTKQELDFIHEAEHIDKLRTGLASFKKIKIPQVYWSYTTKKVLTMEYLEGRKLSELKHIKTNREQIAKTLLDCELDQVFQLGTFHADLHPGNILLMQHNTLGLLDFGIAGSVDQRTRKLGIQLYLAILDKDIKKIVDTLLSYGVPSSKTEVDAFYNDATRLVNLWYEENPKIRRVTHLMHQLFILCARHHITLPRNTILLGKALVTVEATARYINPDFEFAKYSEPKIAQILRKERTPRKIIEKFSIRSKEFAKAISNIPQKTLEAIEDIKHGQLSVNLKDTQFRHLGIDINRSSNRLSYSMVSAALIIASSLMIETGPKVGTYSAISLLCLTVAAIFVIALFKSIAREGKPKYDLHS